MDQSKANIISYNETIRQPIIHSMNGNDLCIINKVIEMENHLKNAKDEYMSEIGNIKQNQCDMEMYLKNTTDNNNCELKTINKNQLAISSLLHDLIELCNKMANDIIKISEKLSQYDIDDGDDLSNNGELDQDMCNIENTSDTEIPSRINTELMNQTDTELTQYYEKNEQEDSSPDEITQLDELHNDNIESKPKRKYTRRKK